MQLMCVDDFKKNLCHYCNTYMSEEPCEHSECWVHDVIAQTDTVDALIPPVKPWDKVWIICKTLDHEKGGLKKTICEGEIFKLSYNGFTTPMEWIDYRWDSPLVGQTTRHDRIDLCLGKTVFLTREEAEAALAKMG